MVKSHLTKGDTLVYYFKYVGEVSLGLLFFCINLPSVMGGFFMEKMMIPDNYKPIRQVGNGKTVSFSFDFPMLSENFIKVYREQDGVQELVDPSEYVWGYIPVEGEDTPVEDIAPENVITFYEAPADGVVIVIAREIPLEQTTPYKTSSGFPAVRVEDNFDKLTAITQQLMEEVDRCVKVEITGDQSPEELLAEVYGKLDSATEVAQNAVDAANAATDAVASAEKTLADVTNYVNTSKTEIDALVTKTTNEIDQTIEEATEEIKEAAVAEADKAVRETIETSVMEAATSAERSRIWAEGEQTEVETLGGELSSKGWALQASNSATSASQSATQAKTSETNAKSYADSLNPETFVKTSGDQTISGVKKFTSIIEPSDAVYLQSSKYNIEDLPTTNGTFCNYEIRGKDGYWTGIFGVETYTDTRRCAKVQARSPNGQYNTAIRVFIDNNNKAYATCPTPAATSNTTEIATTAWVNTRIGGTGTTSISKAANGYATLPNGLIIQWGTVAGSNKDTGTITYSKAFSSATSYSITAIRTSSTVQGDHTEDFYIYGTTSTGCSWREGSDGRAWSYKWIAIGY